MLALTLRTCTRRAPPLTGGPLDCAFRVWVAGNPPRRVVVEVADLGHAGSVRDQVGYSDHFPQEWQRFTARCRRARIPFVVVPIAEFAVRCGLSARGPAFPTFNRFLLGSTVTVATVVVALSVSFARLGG